MATAKEKKEFKAKQEKFEADKLAFEKRQKELTDKENQLDESAKELDQKAGELIQKADELNEKSEELIEKEAIIRGKESDVYEGAQAKTIESKDKSVVEAKVVSIQMSEAEEANAELRRGRVEEYEVPANELGHVHVELESVQMGNDFKKKSKPMVQKFDVRAWDNFRKQAVKLGFNHCKVLYAPENVNIEIGDPKKDEKMKA